MNLKIGDQMPSFEGKDQDGNSVKLSDYSGKKIVLYFYPKDDTPGCTTQACNLRDNYDRLKSQGYEVFGISGDDEASHKKFQEKYNLPFTLIADPDKSINELFGVWVEKNMYGRTYMGTARTTFIADENGIITDIISKVETDNHTEQILKTGITPTESEISSDSLEKTPTPKAKKKPAAKKKVATNKTTTPKKKAVAKKKPATKKKVATKKATTPKKKAVAKKKPATKKKVATKKITTPKKKAVAKKKPATKKKVATKKATTPKKKVVAKKK